MSNSRAVLVAVGQWDVNSTIFLQLLFCSVHIQENECVRHGCLPMFFKFLAKSESD